MQSVCNILIEIVRVPTPSTGVLGIDGDGLATGDRSLAAALGGWEEERKRHGEEKRGRKEVGGWRR